MRFLNMTPIFYKRTGSIRFLIAYLHWPGRNRTEPKFSAAEIF